MPDNKDNLDIPAFLKRTGSKVPVEKDVPMSGVETTEAPKAKVKTPKAAKPIKGEAVKAENIVKAVVEALATPAKAKTVKAKAEADAYGYRVGSLKSKAAAMYADAAGATLAEVKDTTGSVQLNLLTDLEARGFTVKRVKEGGSGKRQVTRYFLSK